MKQSSRVAAVIVVFVTCCVLGGEVRHKNGSKYATSVMTLPRGTWPTSWPKELESLRNEARTVHIAAVTKPNWPAGREASRERGRTAGIVGGINETVYEIPFKKRDDFEKAWPHILKVKSKGAPLFLENSEFEYSTSRSKLTSGVMILGPAWGFAGFSGLPLARRTRILAENSGTYEEEDALADEGKLLRTSPPWPKHLYSDSGELPEYLVKGGEYGSYEWVPAHDDHSEHGEIEFYRARIDIILIVDGEIVDLNRVRMPINTPVIDNRFKRGHNKSLKATR